jgi:hypothetical protein
MPCHIQLRDLTSDVRPYKKSSSASLAQTRSSPKVEEGDGSSCERIWDQSIARRSTFWWWPGDEGNAKSNSPCCPSLTPVLDAPYAYRSLEVIRTCEGRMTMVATATSGGVVVGVRKLCKTLGLFVPSYHQQPIDTHSSPFQSQKLAHTYVL